MRRCYSKDVQAVYLFGSRAMGVAHQQSDYDYAVLTRKANHTKGDRLYHQLYRCFADQSPRTRQNDVIDIVFLRNAGLELCFHVIRYGKVLYDADPAVRLAFENRVQLLYCDYKPILDEFDRTILELV